MTWESISRLAQLTGRTTRTVKTKCEGLATKAGDKNAILYESREALPAILFEGLTDGLDLQDERARLAKEQADKYELENAERRGELLNAVEVREKWVEIASSVRSKLLPLPVKIARVAVGSNDLREIESKVRTELYQALNELADLAESKVQESEAEND